MHEYVKRYLQIEKDRFAKSTLGSYGYYLERLADWLEDMQIRNLNDVQTHHLVMFLDGHEWAPTTKVLAISAFRNFFEWAVAESPAKDLNFPKDRRNIPPQRTPAEWEVEHLLASIDTSTNQGVRDLSIVLLMLDTGLRSSEVCRLRLMDVDEVEQSLTVKVKGGSWQTAVFSRYTAQELLLWTALRNQIAKPGETTYFVSMGGTRPGTGLTRYGLLILFRKMAQRSGLKHFSPHALRRTFATMALRGGASTRLVQVAGRWSNIAMVERYSQALTAKDFEPYSPVNRIMRDTRSVSETRPDDRDS